MFSIKTAPLIRQLLGSPKDGLNSEILLHMQVAIGKGR